MLAKWTGTQRSGNWKERRRKGQKEAERGQWWLLGNQNDWWRRGYSATYALLGCQREEKKEGTEPLYISWNRAGSIDRRCADTPGSLFPSLLESVDRRWPSARRYADTLGRCPSSLLHHFPAGDKLSAVMPMGTASFCARSAYLQVHY